MIFTKTDVRNMCEVIAPQFDFDPKLIYAVCLQEGGKNSKGEFSPDVARLEQGFYRKYVESKMQLATTSEVLLSASYGIMQMMGESLRQAGYFDWYFGEMDNQMQSILGHPLSQFAIPNAIDAYCENLEWMIKWGCGWMKVKRIAAKGDTKRMLGLWNGDLSGQYAAEVLSKMASI